MKVSLLIPSVFPEHLARTLDNIYATTRSIDYEVVVVSPFEVNKPRVVWVREEQPRGCVPAHVAAFQRSAGDFVVPLADDIAFVENWDQHCLQNFQARSANHKLFSLGLHVTHRNIGTVFGIYYPFFPFTRRSCLEAVGYYDAAYQAHFADSDLALRFWAAGGRCEFSRSPLIWHANPADRDVGRTRKNVSLHEDMAIFRARWAGRYGAGWDTSRLEGFNLELNPLMQLTLVENNSVWLNDPLFKRLYDNYQNNVEGCTAVLKFADFEYRFD